MVIASQTQSIRPNHTSTDFLLQSANTATQRVIDLARGVAVTPTTVLLSGESGTGKEVLARYMHLLSPRRNAAFVAVNCGAIPETLMESELFGHEKGAFSGAIARRVGKFEQADGGTLLLDEISEMPLDMQAKLLRVIQEGEVDRLGGLRPVPVDVRIIATTNRNLKEMVAQGLFREDLYYRINVFPLSLIPLRERGEDMETLTLVLMNRIANRFGQAPLRITQSAMGRLKQWSFPGNIRELNNILERSAVLAQGGTIDATHIIIENEQGTLNASPAPVVEIATEGQTLREIERNAILNALRAFEGNRTHASEQLGISIRTLRNRLREYRNQGFSVPQPSNGLSS